MADDKVETIPDTDEVDVRRPRRRYRYITVEPIIILYYLCGSPAALLAEQYVFHIKSIQYNYTDSYGNVSYCSTDNGSLSVLAKQQKVQGDSAYVMLVLRATGFCISILSTLIIGSISDLLRRKVVIILPVIGEACNTLTSVLVISLNLSYWYLLVGSMVAGFLGGFGTVLMGCCAHAADTSTEEQRAVKLTIVDISIGIANGVSQLASGHMITQLGYQYSFAVLLGIAFLNLLYIIFILQETQENRLSRHKSCMSLFRPFEKIYLQDNGTNRRWKLQLCLCIQIIVVMVNTSKLDCQTYFLKGQPMCFNPEQVGYFAGGFNLAQNVGSMIGSNLLLKLLGEWGLVIMSCVSGAASMVLMALVQHLWMLALVPVIGCCGFLVFPMIRAVSSMLVEPHEQGAMFAVVTSGEVASALVGTVIFNAVYPATLHITPGFVFMVMAAIYLLGMGMAWIQMYFTKKENVKSSEEEREALLE